MVTEIQAPEQTEVAPTVFFTDTAREKLVELIGEQRAVGKEAHLRIMVQGGGCAGFSYGMFFDNQERPGDNVSDVDGVKVLIDDETLEMVAGSEVDYADSLLGRGFTVKNPNAASTCGCGHSFRVQGKKGQAEACH
jgi:iron-sulfur cluster assembly accessory protein